MPYVEWRGNKCRVKWWAGEYQANGKKKLESKSGFTDEAAAWNHGLDREHDVRHGTHVKTTDGKTLMSAYCWDWYEAQDLRHTSLNSYKAVIKKRIIPYWGNRAVGDITAFEYDAWHTSLKAAVRRGDISSGYKSQILMIFGMMMDDAVDRYHLRKTSPVKKAKPRRGRYKKAPREKKYPLDIAVVHALARNAYTVWGYTGWVYLWTAAFTAMRPAEMYGLQRGYASSFWPGSDPDAGRREESLERYGSMPALRVQHQVQWAEGELALTPPKYDSHRTLVVPPFLHEMHTALLASHQSPWVFPALKGGCVMGGDFDTYYWHHIRDGAEARTGRFAREAIPAVKAMEGKRIYLLRHGHKEWIDEDGHPEVATEARMGHELPGVKGVYSNLTPIMEGRIAATLQERWEKFAAGEDVWSPPFPSPLPVDHSAPLFSQLRIISYSD